MPRSPIKSLKLFAKSPRTRWSAEQARAVLDRLTASGLTLKEFASREGVDPQRLYRWRAQLGEAHRAHPTFVEITPTAANRSIELALRSGDVLRIPDRFCEDALRKLLGVLDERASRC